MKAISFLGTTDYQTVTYVYQGQEVTTRLFPTALFRFFPNLQTLYVLATPAVQAHPNLQQLREEIPPEHLAIVPIPEGRSEEELWNIFTAITDKVEEKDEVIFDITHSFRSIPFLTFLAAAYLRAARRVHIHAVVYGAYEARPREDPGPRPVFDLTPFVSLLDWLAATNQFIHTGDAQYLARLLVWEGQERKSGVLKDAGETLEDFSRAIMLCRPLEVMEGAGRLESVLKKAGEALARWARPFEVMAGRIKEEYGRHALPHPTEMVPENLQRQLDLIRWYADHGQIIQAVTLAREWMVTAVGWRLFDTFVLQREEREQIELGLSRLSLLYQERCAAEDLNGVARSLQEWPEQEEVRHLWDSLATVRNDLDHAGMNPSPMKAARLGRKAREEVLPALEGLAQKWGMTEETR